MQTRLTRPSPLWRVWASALVLLAVAACSVNPIPTPGADAAGNEGSRPSDDKVADAGPDGAVRSDVVPPEDVGGSAADDAGDVPTTADVTADVAQPRDLGPPPDAVVPPDADFCGNESRIELDDTGFAPVSVTTSELVMDCCSGFVTRFHAAAAAGVDVSAMLIVEGGDSFVGEFDLARLPSGVEFLVRSGPLADAADGAWEDFDGALAGTLSVREEGTAPTRRVVSLCLAGVRTAPVADARIQRLRLRAADVGLLVPWGGGEAGFALHLLANPDTTAVAAAERPLADLELAPEALVDLDWIEYYELATHRVVLSGWRNGDYVRNTLPPFGTQGLPFVVTSGDERIYLGAFWTMLSSEAFLHPAVVIESIDRLGFRIEGAYPTGADEPADPRGDPRLLAAMRHLGKLVE